MTFEEDVELEMEVQKIQRISKYMNQEFIECMYHITESKMNDEYGYMSPYQYNGNIKNYGEWSWNDRPFWYRQEIVLEELANGYYMDINTGEVRELEDEDEDLYAQPVVQSQPVVENNMKRLLTIKPFVL